MASPNDPATFNRASARRIANVVKRVESMPYDRSAKRAMRAPILPHPVILKITGAVAGGGKYIGRVLYGGVAPDSESWIDATLNMPEGMHVPDEDNCYIINLRENAIAKSHTLATGTFWRGHRVGEAPNDNGTPVYAINAIAVEDGIVTAINPDAGQCTVENAGGHETVVNLVYPLGPCKINFVVTSTIKFLRSGVATGHAIDPDIGELAHVHDYHSGGMTTTTTIRRLPYMQHDNVVDVGGTPHNDFSYIAVVGNPADGFPSTVNGKRFFWNGFKVSGGSDIAGDVALDDRREIVFDYTAGATGTPFDVVFEVSQPGTRQAKITGKVYIDLGSISSGSSPGSGSGSCDNPVTNVTHARVGNNLVATVYFCNGTNRVDTIPLCCPSDGSDGSGGSGGSGGSSGGSSGPGTSACDCITNPPTLLYPTLTMHVADTTGHDVTTTMTAVEGQGCQWVSPESWLLMYDPVTCTFTVSNAGWVGTRVSCDCNPCGPYTVTSPGGGNVVLIEATC